jgi:endonuclease/exonuclease/phosphatase family metal-dependent hydrolase
VPVCPGKRSSTGGPSLLDSAKGIASAEGKSLDGKLSALAEKGGVHSEALSMLSGVSTPEEAIAAMKTDKAFADQVKTLAMTYVKDAVQAIDIPPIEGEKEWGTYAIKGLGIADIEIDPEKLSIDVTDCMYVSLADIAVTFTQFDFDFDKHSFPKVKDVGVASATATFDAFVKFDIVVDDDMITVDQVEAEVTIGDLPVDVLGGKHKFLYNMLLSLFSAKVKEAVGNDIKKQVDDSIPTLKEKIAAVTAGFSPDLKGKIKRVDLKGTVSRAVKNPDDEFDPDAVAMANQLNGQLVKDVEAHKKTQVVISNPTPYSFKIKDRPEMPTQGTWIVPPPERIRPNETNVVFGSASKGSSSGTKGTVEYVAKVDGRDQTIKLSYTNPVGSKATSTIETSTAAIEPVTWVTASNFSKAAFDIKLPMEDLDCVDLRNSAMFPDELPHHEDYDQRVRRLAGDTVSKSMTRLTEIAASPSAREAPVEPDHSDDLVVHIASWNCGNAPPPVPEKMDPWVPNGGRGADIIVVCTQECTYDAQKKIQEEILGKLQVTVQKASGFPGDYDDDCDRYVELSIEPDASAGKVKKAPATEGQTKVVKAEANPEFNERVLVMEKDGSLSDEGFSVFPSSARLTVRLMSEKGRKKVLLAEGEYSLLTCLNGELSHEQTEVEVALTHQEGATACEGAIALGLSYDLHLEATKLEEQVDFSRQAAASVEEQKAGAETAPGNIGILRISVLRAEGLTSDSTSMATARVTASGGVGDSIDPQVRLHVGPQTANTKTLEATTAPEWKEEFAFNLADVTLDELKLEIVNVEDDTEQFYGSITVPTKQFIDSSNSGDHHIFTDEEHLFELDTGSVLYIKAAFEAGATVQAQGAAEEDEDDEDGEGETEDSVHFFNTCKLAAGSQYYEVGRQVLWQIQMIVLAKVEKRPHISGVELRKVKTGLVGGLIANKGGVVCKLVYKGHELAFVNTHLAAHEGIEFRQDRNRMAAEVQASARVGNRAIDLGNQFHHSFWAGDLNYRVEFKDWVNADGTLNKAVTKDEKMLQVKRIIDQEKWPVLWAADELRRELAAGRAFAGFQDGICDFPPTFKVEKGYVLQYNPKRVPSYCDRILWRSTEGYDACIHQEAFAAAPNLITSDHKPVWARYRISVPETLTARQRRVAQPSKVVVRLRNVAVEGLNADLTTSRLVVHDEELLNNDTAAMTNLSGDEGMVMPTRVSCSATLQGRVQDPSDASRASSSQFSHAVVLQVEETGAMSGTDLGYATMALRDAEAEETVQLDASEAAEWNSHKKLRGKILHGPLFPLFRRQVRLPLSLNGVNTGGYLGACLEVAESYTPLYVLHAPTSLRMGIEKTTDTVCQLAAGDRVTVLNRKKRDGEVRLRVRMWLPAPARQEGWISEASADKQTLAAKTDVCAHRIWRPPSLRRGWALKKDGGAAWERVWCQSEDGTKVAFFESNDAGEGGAAVGELPVADVEEATLPTGALRDTDQLAHALPLLFFSCKYFNSVCSMLRLSAPSCHHKQVP